MTKTKELLSCSFCGKSQKAVARLIAGPSAHICDECVALCNAILTEYETDEETKSLQVRGLEDLGNDVLEQNLAGAATVSRNLDKHFKATVLELRRRGHSWAQIGKALGTSRQAAWERFADDD